MKDMKFKYQKTLSFLFLMVGIGNFLMMVDVLLSDADQSYSIFSIPTSKGVNAAFYALISCFLIYTGIQQNRKLNNQKKQN